MHAHVPQIVRKAQVAASDVLQQAMRWGLDEHGDHVAEHCAHSVETLGCGTDVVQPHLVKQNLLHNERGHGFAELAAGLHDAQAQRDNLRLEQKIDHLAVVNFDQRADHAQGCQAQVLEGAALRDRVEKRVQVQRNVCCERVL